MNIQEQNKAVVRRLYEETNKANILILDEVFDENVMNHQSGVTAKSQSSPLQKLRDVFNLFYKGFPDTHHTIDALIAEDDLVVARISATGTHTGTMLGVEATGKAITMSGIVIYRFRDGKIIERWADEDRLGFYSQLGVIQLPNVAHYR